MLAYNEDKVPLLSVSDLHVRYRAGDETLHAVNGVSFSLERGRTLGIVGESGCGKSTVAFAVMRLLGRTASITNGEIVFDGRPLLDIDASGMQAIRGKQIALVSQDPLTSLNPVMTVGAHLKEILRRHTGLRGQAAKQRSAELLRMVGIPDPEARLAAYPYQLSGGMRQRVVMALALSCEPKLIIADEPTTALDVTIQAQILELLGDLRERLGTSIVLVSHDLGVVAGLADRVMVMYGGTVIEEGQAEDVLVRPLHPYTIGLIASRPELDGPREARLTAIPGASPRLMEQPRGCVFAPRCQHRMPVCAQTPALAAASNGDRRVACWLHAPAADEERHAEC